MLDPGRAHDRPAAPETRPGPGLAHRPRPADHRHVPAGAADHHRRPADHRRGGAADPHRHARRPGPRPVADRPAVGRGRAAHPAAGRRGRAHPRLDPLRDRPQPGRPRHPAGAAGPGRRGVHGGRDGDRAGPVLRAGRGQAALPADAGDGRRADPGADHRRHRAELDLVAWRVRGARGPRRGHPHVHRAGPAGDPAGRAAAQRRRARHRPRLRAAADRPVVHRADPGGRSGHGGAVRVRVRLVVRLPGAVRPERAAVRLRLRGRRDRPDRRHPVQRAAAAPLVAVADPDHARWPSAP